MFCVFCDGNGSIYKAKIKEVDEDVYICDECETLWHGPYIKNIGTLHDANDLSVFVETHGLTYEHCEIADLGYGWDKRIIENPDIVYCPFCTGHGVIYEVTIKALNNMLVRFCDNCNAMWREDKPIDTNTQETLLGFLATKQLNYGNAFLRHLKLDWSKQNT